MKNIKETAGNLVKLNSDIEIQEKIKSEPPIYLGIPKDMKDFVATRNSFKTIQIKKSHLYALDKEDSKKLVEFCKELWDKRQDKVINRMKAEKSELEKKMLKKLIIEFCQ